MSSFQIRRPLHCLIEPNSYFPDPDCYKRIKGLPWIISSFFMKIEKAKTAAAALSWSSNWKLAVLRRWWPYWHGWGDLLLITIRDGSYNDILKDEEDLVMSQFLVLTCDEQIATVVALLLQLWHHFCHVAGITCRGFRNFCRKMCKYQGLLCQAQYYLSS